MSSIVTKSLETARILRDDPVRDTSEDTFRIHTAYAKSLAKVLVSCPDKLVVGLFGKWGSGKTTILELLHTELDELRHKEPSSDIKQPVYLYFDLWKHSNEPLKRWLLLEMRKQLSVVNNKFENFEYEGKSLEEVLYGVHELKITESKLNTKVQQQLIRLVIGFFLLSLIVLGVLVFSGLGQTFLSIILGSVGLITSILFGLSGLNSVLHLAGTKVFEFISSVAPQLLTQQETSGTSYHLAGSAEQFENIFKHMVRVGCEKQNTRLVFCFDNIDRVDAPSVLELLSTIKTYLGESGCVYLVPCDEEALITHLSASANQQQTSEQRSKFATEYIEKCFQLSFRLPPFLSFDVDDYTMQLSEESKLNLPQEAIDLILLAYRDGTPRKLKRFINDLIGFLIISDTAKDQGLISDSLAEDKECFVKWMILHSKWPGFVEQLQSDPELWKEIHQDLLASRQKELAAKRFDPELIKFLSATTAVITPEDILPLLSFKLPNLQPDGSLGYELQQALRAGDTEKLQRMLETSKKHQFSRIIIESAKSLCASRRETFARNAIHTLLQIRALIPEDLQSSMKTCIYDLLNFLLLTSDDIKSLQLQKNEIFFDHLAAFYNDLPLFHQEAFSRWFVQLFNDITFGAEQTRAFEKLFPIASYLRNDQLSDVGNSLARQIQNSAIDSTIPSWAVIEKLENHNVLRAFATTTLADCLTKLLTESIQGESASIHPWLISAWLAVKSKTSDTERNTLEKSLLKVAFRTPPDAKSNEVQKILGLMGSEDFTDTSKSKFISQIIATLSGRDIVEWNTWINVLIAFWPDFTDEQKQSLAVSFQTKLGESAPDKVVRFFKKLDNRSKSFIIRFDGMKNLPSIFRLWLQQNSNEQNSIQQITTCFKGNELVEFATLMLDGSNTISFRLLYEKVLAETNNTTPQLITQLFKVMVDEALQYPELIDVIEDIAARVKSNSEFQVEPLLNTLMSAGATALSSNSMRGIAILTAIGSVVSPNKRGELCKKLLNEHVQGKLPHAKEALKQIVELSKSIPNDGNWKEVVALEAEYAFELSKLDIDAGCDILIQMVPVLGARAPKKIIDSIIKIWELKEIEGEDLTTKEKYLDVLTSLQGFLTTADIDRLRALIVKLLSTPKPIAVKKFGLKILSQIIKIGVTHSDLVEALDKLSGDAGFRDIIEEIKANTADQ